MKKRALEGRRKNTPKHTKFGTQNQKEMEKDFAANGSKRRELANSGKVHIPETPDEVHDG